MSDLHTALEAAITSRLEVARAATPGPWDAHPVHVFMDGRIQARIAPAAGGLKVFADVIAGGDFEYFRVHDPADAVRRYTADLDRLNEHKPCDDCDPASAEDWTHPLMCHQCAGECIELPRLLDVYPEVTRP